MNEPFEYRPMRTMCPKQSPDRKLGGMSNKEKTRKAAQSEIHVAD